MENQNERDELLFEQLKKKKRRKRRRVILTVLFLLVLAGGGIFTAVNVLRARVRTQFAQNTAEVKAHTVQSGRISTTVSGSGSLSYLGHEEISLPDGVELEELLVSAGDQVQKGDTLATVDINSVMTALADTQSALEKLDDQINDAKNDTVSTQMTTSVTGRVKAIYAEAGDNVVDVMTEHGALAVLSLDGLMTVQVEAELTPGQSVSVTTGEKVYPGMVESCIAGKSTITLTDNGPEYGASADITDEAGKKLGTGTLAIRNPLSITGYAGTVSYVNAHENASIWAGSSLFTLKNTSYTANYDTLLRTRAETEKTLNELIGLLRSGSVTAPFSGVVTEVAGDSSSDTATAAAASFLSSASSDNWLVTVAPDEQVSVSVAVDETDILSLELGQNAVVKVSSIGDETYPGTVTEISKLGISSSGVTQYTATVTLDKQEQMLSGMTASVDIQIQGVDDVVLIPVDALHQTRNTSYVFTSYNEELKEYGDMVEITTGASNSSFVEVVTGLKPGDTVYYTEKANNNFFSMMPGFGGMGGNNRGNYGGGNRGNRGNNGGSRTGNGG